MLEFLIVVGFIIISFFYYLFSKLKELLEDREKYKKLSKEYYNLTIQEADLKKQVEKLTKEKQGLEELENQKEVLEIFKILAENDSALVTKKKLAKLWDTLPYYPPDWDIRKWIVRKRDNYTCKKCGKNLYVNRYSMMFYKNENENGEVHHLIPLSMGGTNEIKNLVFVCKDCHKKLHDELYNFNFSKFGYQPLYGWEYYSLYYSKKEIFKEDIESYNFEEPDTDLYYNISTWEDQI